MMAALASVLKLHFVFFDHAIAAGLLLYLLQRHNIHNTENCITSSMLLTVTA